MYRLFAASSLLLILALAMPPVVTAGPPGCGSGCGKAAGQGAGIFGIQGDFYFTALINAKEIGLDATQVKELKRRYFENRSEVEALSQKIEGSQRRLNELMIEGDASPEQLQTVIAEMRNLRGDLQVNVHKSVEEGQTLLTEEQRNRLWQIVKGNAMGCNGPCVGGPGAMARNPA